MHSASGWGDFARPDTGCAPIVGSRTDITGQAVPESLVEPGSDRPGRQGRSHPAPDDQLHTREDTTWLSSP